jgi:hypothetical protein
VDWVTAIMALAAIASPVLVWLLQAGIQRSLDLRLQREVEVIKSSLSVRAEFSKLVAQRRLEALLDVWSLSLKLGSDVYNRPEKVALETLIQHTNAVLSVQVLFPRETVDAIRKFQAALSDLQVKMHRAGGDELRRSLDAAGAASDEFAEHLRRLLDRGFPDDAPRA